MFFVPPTSKLTDVGDKLMLVGWVVVDAAVTETAQVAFLPLLVVAVIVADPALTAVTLPVELTVATDVLLLLHVISALLPEG